MTVRQILTGLGALIALVFGATASAEAAELSFTSPAKIAFTLPGDNENTVWLRSDGASGRDVLWRLIVDVGKNKTVVLNEIGAASSDAGIEITGPPGIPVNRVVSYRVKVRNYDPKDVKSAQLVANVPRAAPAAVEVSLTGKTVPSPSVALVLLVPLVFAIVFVFVRSLGLEKETVGSVDLDFSKSFATTLTGVGALLGTILASGLLAETASPISKSAFQALNLTFGVLVLIAPLCFLVAQERQVSKVAANGETTTVVHYSGSTSALLFASLVTVWAFLGELWAIFLLLGELDIDGAATTVMQLAIGAGAILVLWYSWRKLKWIVDTPDGASAPTFAANFVGPVASGPAVREAWTPL